MLSSGNLGNKAKLSFGNFGYKAKNTPEILPFKHNVVDGLFLKIILVIVL